MSEEMSPYLTVRLEGPAVGPARVPLRAFITLAAEMLSAVERVALLQLDQVGSVRRGRRPDGFREALALDLIGFTHGSPAAVAYFDRAASQMEFEGRDFGEDAYRTWMEGMAMLARDPEASPRGFDIGVMMKVRDMGRLFSNGIATMDFTLNYRPEPIRAEFSPTVAMRVAHYIARPEPHQHEVEGRLLMADFKATGRQFRVHPPDGEPVICEFDQALQDEVQQNIRKYVRVRGEAASSPAGKVKLIHLNDIEPLEEPLDSDAEPIVPEITDAFWHHRSVEELAEAQGAPLAADFDRLLGGWPGEFDDGFEEWVDCLRSGASERGQQ